jgi:hypothetical protein
VYNEYLLIKTNNSLKNEVAHRLNRINETLDVEPLAVDETEIVDPFFKDYNLIAKIKIDKSTNFKK